MTREEAIRILASSCIPGSKQTEALETLIPELAESEDERITDTIFNCLYQCCDTGFISGTQRDNALSWLEKQKERKPEWSEEDENALNYLHELISFGYTEKFFDAQTAADMREWLNARLKSLKLSWKTSEDELAKKHLEGYIMGREDTMHKMKDFIESHFNCENAKKGTPIVYNTQSGTSTLKAEG